MPRYPSPFMQMGRPIFPPRPPGAIGIIPPLSRPPVPGIRGPIIPLVIRPAIVPRITPTEKPQTTVYVGKIASTVESDFILSLLQVSLFTFFCFLLWLVLPPPPSFTEVTILISLGF